jgi:hypothetical protein
MSVMVLCRPVPADRAFCNHLQNVGATTYKNVLQLPAKKACKKHLPKTSEYMILVRKGFKKSQIGPRIVCL